MLPEENNVNDVMTKLEESRESENNVNDLMTKLEESRESEWREINSRELREIHSRRHNNRYCFFKIRQENVIFYKIYIKILLYMIFLGCLIYFLIDHYRK
jgi:hypothetical protein